MPCDKPHHHHYNHNARVWNTTGILAIERCEKWCAFCGKKYLHAYNLRRHVVDVHVKNEYPFLEVYKLEKNSTGLGRGESCWKRVEQSRSRSGSGGSFASETNGPVSPSLLVEERIVPDDFVVPDEAFFDHPMFAGPGLVELWVLDAD